MATQRSPHQQAASWSLHWHVVGRLLKGARREPGLPDRSLDEFRRGIDGTQRIRLWLQRGLCGGRDDRPRRRRASPQRREDLSLAGGDGDDRQGTLSVETEPAPLNGPCQISPANVF